MTEQTHRRLDQISSIAYSYKPTLYNTYIMAISVLEKGIPGVFVECGVAAGAQLAAMQLAAMEKAPVGSSWFRSIHAFDSFEGIPLAGPKDADQPGIGAITHDVNKPERERLVSSGITVHSEDSVRQNISSFGLPIHSIVFHKGWFQDTVPGWDKPIALLRLDGDLYESTAVCLKHMEPFLLPGGVCIIDDYALPGCRKAVEEYFSDTAMPDMIPVEGGHGPVYYIK